MGLFSPIFVFYLLRSCTFGDCLWSRVFFIFKVSIINTKLTFSLKYKLNSENFVCAPRLTLRTSIRGSHTMPFFSEDQPHGASPQWVWRVYLKNRPCRQSSESSKNTFYNHIYYIHSNLFPGRIVIRTALETKKPKRDSSASSASSEDRGRDRESRDNHRKIKMERLTTPEREMEYNKTTGRFTAIF